MLNREFVSLTITLLGFCAGIGIFIWRTSESVTRMQTNLQQAITANRYDITEVQNTLKQAIAEARYESNQNDLKHQNIQSVLELGFNGYREKVDHLGTRVKSDIAEMDKRLTDTEQFLAKELKFQRR